MPVEGCSQKNTTRQTSQTLPVQTKPKTSGIYILTQISQTLCSNPNIHTLPLTKCCKTKIIGMYLPTIPALLCLCALNSENPFLLPFNFDKQSVQLQPFTSSIGTEILETSISLCVCCCRLQLPSLLQAASLYLAMGAYLMLNSDVQPRICTATLTHDQCS